MNAKHISIIVAVVALLAGCAKSPIEEVKPSEQLADLELSRVGAIESKAAIDGTDFPQTGEIGLFLFKDELAETPYGESGYSNVKYAYNSSKSKWTASPSIKVGSTPGHLYGYYPYSSTATDVKEIPVESSLNGDDVMYATKQTVNDKTASQTAITMNHALARVSIKVINNGYTGKAELSKIKFSGAKIAPEGTLNALDGKITATNSDVTLDVPTANQTITAAGTTYECLLVPSGEDDNKQTVTLTLTIDGEDKTATLSGDNGVIIAQGTKSNITITLSNTGITVQTVSVENWNVVEVGEYKVTVKVDETDATANDILIWAYADGDAAKILAVSLSKKLLGCTLTGMAEVARARFDNTFTFTISDICSDITATIGYDKPLTIEALSNNTTWGTASFKGSPYKGETISFTATAATGYQFVEWQDTDGKTLSKNNPYSVTLASDLTVKAVFDIYGALPGVFTVEKDDQGNSTKAVRFSNGNLYRDSSNKCFFESKQYEFSSSWDNNHVSHFYWSKYLSNARNLSYEETKTSTDDVFFTNDVTFKVGNAHAGAYKTLSKDEWEHLITHRSASTVGETANARYAKATIEVNESTSVTGLILFPDVFAVPEGVNTPTGINAQNAGYNTNTYSVDEWEKLESAGAVFLPAAGQRQSSSVTLVGNFGKYWSSSPNEKKADDAFSMSFNSSIVSQYGSSQRSYAYCVRLVTEVK